MKFVCQYCILLSLFFLQSLSHAQVVNHLTVKDGLGGRQLFKVIQDDKGFIWIANQFGIDRYDGLNIKNYNLDIMENGTSPFRSLKLITDNNKNIWAFTDNGLIFRYVKDKDKFVQYAFLKRFIKNIIFDSNNKLWIITHKDIGYLDKGRFIIDKRLVLKNEFYKSILEFDSKSLLLQTDRNIYKYNTSTAQRESLIKISDESEKDFVIESFLYDSSNNCLWIGTIEKGIYKYDLLQQKLIHLQDTRLDYHPVLSLCKLDNQYLLIGTDGIGLGLLNTKSLKIEKLYNKQGKGDEYLLGGAINNIFKDKNERVWVSTYSGGVYILDYSVQEFKTIKEDRYSSRSLNNNVVCDIMEDSSGQLWFATNNNVCIWDMRTNSWNHILNSKNVMTLFEDSKQNIWIGTYSTGVYQVNKQGQVLKNFINKGNRSNQIGTNFIYSITEDSKGNIWFGGKKMGGLTCYDPTTNLFTLVNVNQVNHIINKNANTLFVSSEIGLFEVDIHNFSVKKIGNDKVIRSNYISDMYLESDSILWLGTYGAGVSRYDLKRDVFDYFTDKEGLPSNIIYSLENHGNLLWFSSENGIGSIDLKTYKVTNFSVMDGLSSNQFRQLSKWKSKSGNIYFGSYDGVTYFNPETVKKSSRQAKLFLDEFRLFNNAVYPGNEMSPLKHVFDENGELELSYDQHSFSIVFTAIDHSIDKARRYMWKLENMDKNWIGPTSEHIANYTNISKGDYLFKIRYLDENNNILDERRMSIKILPPFWDTVLAKIIFLILLCISGYGIYLYFKQRYKRKQAKDKIDFFINTAHDIRTPLSLVSGPIYELKEYVHATSKTDYLFDLVTSNLNKLNGIITQLLDFQKIYDDKGQLIVKKWNVNAYLIEKFEFWKISGQNKQLFLELDLPEDVVFEWFDVEKMDKILDNLVSNAIKYTPESGSVLIKLSFSDKYWQIDIFDTGIGIRKDDQKNLFTRFYRASNVSTAKQMGSGLGLLLVKKTVLLHRANIWVKSVENKGSTFSVQFMRGVKAYKDDIILDDQHIISVHENEEANNTSSYPNDKTLKVLIVEDNQDLRDYMITSLSGFYTVFSAQNGLEGWALILKNKPDIIVSDLQMPVVSGLELCVKVKETFETSHIPIILLTVVNEPSHIAKALNFGADDYIEKPFQINYLKLKINNIVQNRQIMRQKFFNTTNSEDAINSDVNDMNSQFVLKATSIIENNISNSNFSIATLAKELSLSRTLMFTKFNSITGYTPNDFIKIIRMKRAISLLREQKYTINEVALMVGFEEPSYFSTSFKKMYGKSPKQFVDENLLSS